jgi:hypothetical protein
MEFGHPLHAREQKQPIIGDHLALRMGEPHKLAAEGRLRNRPFRVAIPIRLA